MGQKQECRCRLRRPESPVLVVGWPARSCADCLHLHGQTASCLRSQQLRCASFECRSWPLSEGTHDRRGHHVDIGMAEHQRPHRCRSDLCRWAHQIRTEGGGTHFHPASGFPACMNQFIGPQRNSTKIPPRAGTGSGKFSRRTTGTPFRVLRRLRPNR